MPESLGIALSTAGKDAENSPERSLFAKKQLGRASASIAFGLVWRWGSCDRSKEPTESRSSTRSGEITHFAQLRTSHNYS